MNSRKNTGSLQTRRFHIRFRRNDRMPYMHQLESQLVAEILLQRTCCLRRDDELAKSKKNPEDRVFPQHQSLYTKIILKRISASDEIV